MPDRTVMDLAEKCKYILDEYTSHYTKFPWQWYGDIPKIGETHSYLCTILSPYVNTIYKSFLSSKPTLRELKRITDLMDEDNKDRMIINIVDYCTRMYDSSKWSRDSVEKEVFRFIVNCDPIIKNLKEKIMKDLTS